MANESDRAVGIVEGISSSEIHELVALWTAYIHFCCFSRRAPGFCVERLHVSPYVGISFQHIYAFSLCKIYFKLIYSI